MNKMSKIRSAEEFACFLIGKHIDGYGLCQFIQQRDAEVWQSAMERAAEIVRVDPTGIALAPAIIKLLEAQLLSAKNELSELRGEGRGE